MPDIRDRVEQDRGLLKKIQLVIPGYAGYRRREDIRAADNLLRIQLANQMKGVRGDLEEIRDGCERHRRQARLDCLREADRHAELLRDRRRDLV